MLQHRVRAKESVTGIERLYNVSRPDLSLVNAEGLRIEGRIIYVPRFAGGQDTPSPRASKPRLAVARATVTDQRPKHLSKPLTVPARTAAIDRGKQTSLVSLKHDAKLVALRTVGKRHPMQGLKAGPAAKMVKAAAKRNLARPQTRKT